MAAAEAISLSAAELTRLFVAVSALLAFAYLFGSLFQRLRMPRVVGEIFGGLLLGPTVFGILVPGPFKALFVDQGKLLAVVYWFGLLLLMFISGFEVRTKFDRRDRRTVVALVVGSTVIPFLFGWYITSFFDLKKMIGPAGNLLALKLIVSVAMAVTSIPVISKMFLDLGIMKTRFAKIVLSAATIHDVVLWIFVTIATGLVTASHLSVGGMAKHVGLTIALFAAALLLVPRLVSYLSQSRPLLLARMYEMGSTVFTLMLFVALTSYLEINTIFGAFLAGIVIGYLNHPTLEEVKSSIKRFSLAFFIPLYFAIVGVKLDIIGHFDLRFFLMFFAFATGVQVFAVVLTAKLLRYDWLSSLNLALAMNERGGPGIVLATLAFEIGVINTGFFVTLVINAILTSMLGGIWLRYVLSKNWLLLE